jgi:hypothetical protein
MPRRESPLQSEMLQGTLDMLVLQTLVLGPAHGHSIAHQVAALGFNLNPPRSEWKVATG